MWADILTKLVQGAKFHEMRAHLMKCPVDNHEQIPMGNITGEMHTLMDHQLPITEVCWNKYNQQKYICHQTDIRQTYGYAQAAGALKDARRRHDRRLTETTKM